MSILFYFLISSQAFSAAPFKCTDLKAEVIQICHEKVLEYFKGTNYTDHETFKLGKNRVLAFSNLVSPKESLIQATIFNFYLDLNTMNCEVLRYADFQFQSEPSKFNEVRKQLKLDLLNCE